MISNLTTVLVHKFPILTSQTVSAGEDRTGLTGVGSNKKFPEGKKFLFLGHLQINGGTNLTV